MAGKRVPLEKKKKTELVKIADDFFSKYVRLRDSELDGNEYVGKCITCSKNGSIAWHDGKKIRFVAGWDAGHFVSRGCKLLRYSDENVNLQCKFHCNKMKSGNLEKYKPALDDKYGNGTWRRLEDEAQANKYYKFSRDELLQIIADSRSSLAWYENQLKG